MPTNLRINNIQVHYGKAEAIHDVTAVVEDGSVTGIIGANGAGKSSIMRVLSGLVPLSGGEIWYGDMRTDRLQTHEIVQMGIVQVPEGRRLFPHMSVLSNIKIGAYLNKNPKDMKQRMKMVFERFPILKNRQKQRAVTLSGGEQQMLALARALMAGPKLLLMDEPSWGLAPLIIQDLAEIIGDINREGITVLLVEQNAGLTFKLTEYIYILEVGRMILEGATEKIVTDAAVRKAFLG